VKTPATTATWDALPDPTGTVGAELPTAPYLPDGAPVNPPQYATGNYPHGAPYKAPDGSTVQPMASVTNNSTINNHSVTVETYNITTHDAAGAPVADPVPEVTGETPTECESNPDAIGCQSLGEFDHPIPKSSHVFTFSPESVDIVGQYPADIAILGSALSFAPACGAMTTIKPIVVGSAALVAAFILFGGMRGAD